MLKFRILSQVTVAVLFVVLAAVPVYATEQITLQLKWIHQFQFAGFYAAKQQGYYRDAGLDVTILPATPGKDPVLDVINGKAEYGVGTSSLLLMRNAGKPVVALAVLFQHSPYILLTKEHSASQTIHSLAGKRLMMEPQADELLAYLKKEGITAEKMKMIEHSFNIKDLIEGKVDAISGYVTDDPYELEQAGFAYHAYTPRSAGIDFYGDNLFTTENELKKNPARVKAFREASLKGWQYAMQHPDEIIDLIISSYSPQSKRGELMYEAEQIRQLIQPNLVEIGYMHEGRWRHIADNYAELGMLPKEIDLKKFMYNPHPQKDLHLIYRISALILCLAVFIIAVRLIITSRSLKISEEKFFKAFENAPLMKTISNIESGVLLDVNAKFCEVTGFVKTDIIGRNSAEIGLLTPKDRQKLLDAFKLNGSLSNVELKLHTSTGAIRDCVFFGEVIKVGSMQQLLCVILDVTDQRRSDEQIRKLSQAVEQSPVTIVITDTKGNIEFVNPKFTELTGYTFEEAVGLNPRILKADDNSPDLYKRLWRTITAGHIWEGEFHNRKKNGELFWERAAISPLRNSDGVITHYLGIKEDVTEQKKVREQLLQSQKMEAFGQLAGGIAHDFNNLLTPIIGYSDMLGIELARLGGRVERAERITQAAFKARDLTRQLMTFGRRQTLHRQLMELNDVVRQFADMLQRTIRENIEINLSLSPESTTLFIDRGQIEQIIMNLVVNAQDAIADRGAITIETSTAVLDEGFVRSRPDFKPGRYIMMSVSDSGRGIDKETLKQIFDPFFTTKAEGEGTGLGLANVYGIVKQHAGTILVYSEPGHGTVFKIYFPGTDEEPSETPPEPAPADDGKNVSGTVLLVEDDENVRVIARDLLLEIGYNVVDTEYPSRAITLFNDNDIDLLVTDVIMPEMNGPELYNKLSALRPGLKVLFMSGYTDKALSRQIELKENLNLICKPFTLQEMALKVAALLDG